MWTATSQSICSVTDEKDQAAKRKFTYICKEHFSSKADEAFCFMNKFVNKLYEHRSCFPLVKCYFGNMGRPSSWGMIPLPAPPEGLSCQPPQGLANAFLLYETSNQACSSNTGYIYICIY